MTTLKEQRNAIYQAALGIVDRAKAADRDLTAAEVTEIEAKTAEIKRLDAQIKQAAAGDAFWNEVGSASAGGDFYGDGDRSTKRFTFRGLSNRIARGMKSYSTNVSPGVKALVPAGETVIDIPLVNDVPFPGGAGLEEPPRLIEALPVVVRPAPVYSLLRQTVIATPGTATVVASGAVKPTMQLGVERVDSELKVVAVLSEPIDKFLLEDAEALATWVRAELAEAVVIELERQVLSGTGTGTDFTGLNATSGIQTQAFVTDRLITLQHGLSKLESIGVAPSLIALAPADWLAIQTLRNASGSFDVGGPVDATARTAWGTPVVLAPGLTAGTGFAIGADSVLVSTDNRGLRVEWGTPGDTFTRNQLVARAEGRFALDVTRPHGVVKMTLTGV